MRIGIIGAGNVARAHLTAARTLPGLTIAGVYDIAADRARRLAGQVGSVAYDRPEPLYRDADAIIIASPNHTHARYALEAMGRHRPVLCEKPMATTAADAGEMLAEADRMPGLPHAVGFNYRFAPAVRQLRAVLDAGILGTPRLVSFAFRRDSALTRPAFTWRDSELGRSTSGALGDLGVHLIDLVRFLTTAEIEPRSCRTSLRTVVPIKDGMRVRVDDDAQVTGRLSNGADVTLIASKSAAAAEKGLRLRIVGDRAEAAYDSRHGTGYRLRTGERWVVHPLPGTPPLPDPAGEVYGWASTFRDQLQEWAGLFHGHAPRRRLADLRDGLRAQTVLQELLDSALV